MIARTKSMPDCAKCVHRKHARKCGRDGCECAYRSTPRKRVKARNEKRRPAVLASAQRAAVIERSGGRCEFERMMEYKIDRGTEPWWERCSEHGRDTAHIIRRHLCTGASVYDPNVALFACRNCHTRFDQRGVGAEYLRVPEAMLAAAIACVKKAEAEREAAGRAVVHLPGESTA